MFISLHVLWLGLGVCQDSPPRYLLIYRQVTFLPLSLSQSITSLNPPLNFDSNPGLEIAETPLRDWVRWDSNCSVSSYASRMSHGGWGGGIEMAACSRMNKVNVHVYEADRRGGGYKRISCFDYPHARETIHVLYRGACHYDALVPY